MPEKAKSYHSPELNPAVKQSQRIASHYPLLHPTGCSAHFCEGGRMIHSNEPRVGQTRSISVVREEAIDFLCQLRRDGVIESDEALQRRMVEVLSEINTNSVNINIKQKQSLPEVFENGRRAGRAGASWYQTPVELEHGLRLAWKHSRRCIMRSQYDDLRLCDLRHIRTSAEMGKKLIDELQKAFNHGDILPTVFVFPPRSIGKPGPMVWNMQLLSFAGYTQRDGTILGDPLNVGLTEAIIELGWTPPSFRTKWDLLPLVTMAEGEDAVITEIPKHIFPLVPIRHTKYDLEFDKLGLRWVPAPALSRLGFDIGGVQYTATPFVGWFMDAEIGVRDLADRQRYNVLPSIIEVLGWVTSVEAFEELLEMDKLRLLSNAQSELNYAVCHSFQRAGIRISDTLSASAMYCNFDDEHFKKYGFRLPADPYWLAPPQGSIIPLWHRGGSPNYQPKPLIARHVQDPVKAWKRSPFYCAKAKRVPVSHQDSSFMSSKEDTRTIHIHYCSAGTTARKLAARVERQLCRLLRRFRQFQVLPAESLNVLHHQRLKSGGSDIILLIVSSSGHGDIPPNGQDFARSLQKAQTAPGFNWAIFGNGNSTYSKSFNGAAKTLRDLLVSSQADFLLPDYFNGDTATENPPWNQLDKWLEKIVVKLSGSEATETFDLHPSYSEEFSNNFSNTLSNATISSSTKISPHIRRLMLNVGQAKYEDFSHAQMKVSRLSGPRHYSIASSSKRGKDTSLEFLVTCRPQGQFSNKFLSSARCGTSLQIGFTGTASCSMAKDKTIPIIAFATGSGIAPVKYVLQQRISQLPYVSATTTTDMAKPAPVSLFVGFRQEDAQMISDALQDAIASNIVDILSLTPSNSFKWRAQDNVFNTKFRDRVFSKIKYESCYVFVCASPQAAKGFSSNLSALLGVNVKEALGERYIEEVFEVA